MQSRHVNLAVFLGSVLVALYALEAIMHFVPPNDLARVTRFFGSWDQRDKAQVIQDYRRAGTGAVGVYPTGGHPSFQGLHLFGGIGGALTVGCAENGYWTTYLSDRHGFNNPDVVWDRQEMDLILVGDSFSQGYCVNNGDHFVAALRKKYATLNLGIAGADTLSEFAVLKEYSKNRKAHIVLFQFFTDDISSAYGRSKSHDVLGRYLSQNDFRQNLEEKQESINEHLISDFERKLREQLSKSVPTSFIQGAKDIFFLRTLRHTLNLVRISQERMDPCPTRAAEVFSPETIMLFRLLLDRAAAYTQQIGARLVFVYFPDWWEYACEGRRSQFETIAPLLQESGILLIDAREALSGLGVSEIFAGQGAVHYTVKANIAIGRWLVERLPSSP